MNIPFPYPPTSMGEGDRENYSSLKIKPELHHTFVWGDPPGACEGRDRLTQWCEGDLG